jgi:glycosyltransferase involved in cell wall biosynthesis
VDLSVVVPCYNEDAVIDMFVAELAGVLDDLGRTFEVVLVDDGSSDGTLERLRAAHRQRPEFRYVSLSRNFGKEGAMLAGLRAAKGAAVAIMDADLQHPPALIPTMMARLDAGYEQVVARRDRTGDPLLRTWVSRLYYRFVNSMVDVRLEDGAGDFRILGRQAVEALLRLEESNRFSKGLFAWIGFSTTYISYRNAPRAAGATKWRLRSLFNYGLESVISFNDKPLRLAIHAGVLVSLLAFGYGVWVAVAAVAHGNDVPGYVTLMCAVAGLGGLQMILIGIVGEYVGRIYTETKARPAYLVRESSDGPV